MRSRATRLVCFGGPKDGTEIGVLDHEKEIELATWRQETVTSTLPMGEVPDAIVSQSTTTTRIMLRYRRGMSPRSGRECLVYVGER